MRASQASELLLDSRFLPHRIDVGGNRLIFVPTTPHLIERASFLDGRTAIACGPEVSCRIDEALEVAQTQAFEQAENAAPDRFVFHVAFCGSTRLARILDRPGKVLALREPNLLVELADWKAALDRRSAEDPRLAALVRLACVGLRARWRPEEAVIVKPSNWVNNLLPDLCHPGRDVRPLFITSGRRSFLLAVFRGGRERLAFAARAASHLASANRSHQALLAAAIGAASEPLAQAAHIAVFVHWLQHRQFHDAMAAGGRDGVQVVTFDSIEQAPHHAASAAAAALGLDLSPGDLAEGVARNAGRNAKLPGMDYSPEARLEADRQIERLHGARIEAALAWARDLLPELGEVPLEGERRAG
jgi:hypothetical protein